VTRILLVRFYSIRFETSVIFLFEKFSHFCVFIQCVWVGVRVVIVVVFRHSRRELFFYCHFTIGLPLDLDETLDTSYIFLDIKSEFLMQYNSWLLNS